MTRIAVVSQARMTSSRLPGKVLLEAAGTTFLKHHLDRFSALDLEVIVATTTNDTDTPIVELCRGWGVPVFRGPEDDVLERYARAAREYELEAVIRVTSDCPLIDGEVVRSGIEKYLEADDPHAYVSNTLKRTFPRGFDYEVFSSEALFEAHRFASSRAHREHVTPYLYSNAGGHAHLINVPWHVDKSNYRLTLDTAEDLRLLKTMIEDHGAAALSCAEIIDVMDDHPALVAINRDVEQKRL